MKHGFVLNKTYHEWAEPFISLKELKTLINHDEASDFYLTTQGADELITESNPVDLARQGLEQIYTLKGEKYQFIVNEVLLTSHEPFLTAEEIRSVGRISPEDNLFFKVEGHDREIKSGQRIDLKPYPVEEFYSISQKLVEIKINKDWHKVKPGKYSVDDIKRIGGIKPAYLLGQFINGKLDTLTADAIIIIIGCEEFKGYPNDGSSS